jgi:hypothetical protein
MLDGTEFTIAQKLGMPALKVVILWPLKAHSTKLSKTQLL